MTQKLTNTMFTGTLATSKLTGAMGSNDGSALTGLGGSGATISASSPTISTNPAGGVGTLWSNSTSGELYCCIVATAGQNVWINIGHGIDDVYKFQGTVAGYTSGNSPNSNVISRFTFGSANNATDWGDLTVARFSRAGQVSSTHGYTTGGPAGAGPDVIDKFSFTSSGDATDVGNLTAGRFYACGQSSARHGYTSGGTPNGNVIDKFTFVSDANATDVGDLIISRRSSAGHSSTTTGFVTTGFPDVNIIQSFSFASDGNATDLGDLSRDKSDVSGCSSSTDGYACGGGGQNAPILINSIDKFSFVGSGNSTDHGDLVNSLAGTTGTSSTTDGYVVGGGAPMVDVIQNFPYASNSGGTDLGNLLGVTQDASGTQY